MSTALYVGSFDPFTYGHMNVLQHASNIFEKVYVCVMTNPTKKRFIDVNTSEKMIEQIIKEKYKNVELVKAETNLAYKQAKICNCDYIVRGIRNNGLDYTYEENYADFNKQIGGVNTIFIRADVDKHISSTLIRTLIANNEDVKDYVPPEVYNYIKENSL